MTASNISAVLTPRLKEHVERVVGSMGLYENPGEYIRDLIRRDLNSPTYHVYREILEGFKDIKKKRYIKSTGDWEKDKALFEKREDEVFLTVTGYYIPFGSIELQSKLLQ